MESNGGTRSPSPVSVLATVAVIGGGIGLVLLVLSRWIAQTRGASILLGAIWLVLAGLLVLAFARSRPELRTRALATFAATAIGIVAVGYWTGFRETTVDEDVVVATGAATGAEREAALEGSGGAAADSASVEDSKPEPKPKPKPKPTGPVSLATGSFTGLDGHTSTGKAEVVEENGKRTVTFTGFSVDPGPGVIVYLSPSPEYGDELIELGGLKGSTGNQQYGIPADANLKKFDTVLLWCEPFTTRMAAAELS